MSASPNRPVFIVGPHRSGTTLLYEMLAAHPAVATYDRANCRLPGHPVLAHLWTRLGSDPTPREAQPVWDRFRPEADDVMGAAHATAKVVRWHRRSVARLLRLRGASRFLAKYPRLSLRLEWLDALFPDAVFLHLERDWRAVVRSTAERIRRRRDRGGGWFGVRIPGWRRLCDERPEIVAARVFRVVTTTLEREGPQYGNRYVRLRYSDLCREPRLVLREVAARCALTADFAEGIPEILESTNSKWRQSLGPRVIEEIRSEAPAFFARHEAGSRPAFPAGRRVG